MNEDTVDFGDALQTQAGALALVPDRGFLELRLRDRLDAALDLARAKCAEMPELLAAVGANDER